MDQSKKEEIQECIDVAYENIRIAREQKNRMTAVCCLLGSIAHSLIAIAEMKMNQSEPR